MSAFLINALATKDLDAIADYHFRQGSLAAGEKFFHEFDKKCKQLVAFPESGKRYNDIRPDLRGISLQGYVIFYHAIPEGLEILPVLNGRRDFPALFSED